MLPSFFSLFKTHPSQGPAVLPVHLDRGGRKALPPEATRADPARGGAGQGGCPVEGTRRDGSQLFLYPLIPLSHQDD